VSIFGGSGSKNASENTGVAVKGIAKGVGSAASSIVKGYSKEITGTIDELFGRTKGGSILEVKQVNLGAWGNLSPHLMAVISPCDPNTGEILYDQPFITMPATNIQREIDLSWNSPFENAGAESKAPALMALIQSGQASIYANFLQAGLSGVEGLGAVAGVAETISKKASEISAELQGKTGITKLNSRQVFSGMPPMKISCTLHFRAITDPYLEVDYPIKKLCSWSVAQKLADNGAIIELFSQVKTGGDLIKGLFPSDAPLTVAFEYGGEIYAPMVIGNISDPLDVPMYAKDGQVHSISKEVNVTLSTLTALDKDDIERIFK